MLSEVTRRWVRKLRSGEYQQDTKYLRTEDGYCCLGVLCEQFREETGQGEWVKIDDGRVHHFKYGGDFTYSTIPPLDVAKWGGLHDPTGEYNDIQSLAGHNDAGVSFTGIAEIIEAEPKGLLETS